MKIITVDNFNRESVTQHLVASNITNKVAATQRKRVMTDFEYTIDREVLILYPLSAKAENLTEEFFHWTDGSIKFSSYIFPELRKDWEAQGYTFEERKSN